MNGIDVRIDDRLSQTGVGGPRGSLAAAISLFGFESGAALATGVGVLIEVPVMLTVVWIVNRSKGWYERGAKANARATAAPARTP